MYKFLEFKKQYFFLLNVKMQNLPLFLPVEEVSSEFSKLIDKYPITPYLDNRDSFVRWMHFIHNKLNEKLEKPQISLNDFFVKYYNEYKTHDEKISEYYKLKERIIYFSIVLGLTGTIYYLYDK